MLPASNFLVDILLRNKELPRLFVFSEAGLSPAYFVCGSEFVKNSRFNLGLADGKGAGTVVCSAFLLCCCHSLINLSSDIILAGGVVFLLGFLFSILVIQALCFLEKIVSRSFVGAWSKLFVIVVVLVRVALDVVVVVAVVVVVVVVVFLVVVVVVVVMVVVLGVVKMVLLVVVFCSTATNTSNFFSLNLFSFPVFSPGKVVAKSSGNGVKGLKLNCESRFSTERFCLIFPFKSSASVVLVETTNKTKIQILMM